MMEFGLFLTSAIAVVVGLLLPTANAAFSETCSDFGRGLHIDNTKVRFTEFVAAGTNLSIPTIDPSCGIPYSVVPVDICRVGLNITTSSRSDTLMEIWLPSNWTGRFLSTGNGGTNGCVGYDDMRYAISLGFAATGTNNGHQGFSGLRFLNNAEVVKDFAWRSVHLSAVIGKQITAKFYRKPHTKSYYLGCSTGGRQGFKSAQSFPEDFDGIVAGAPAFNFNNLTSWSGIFHAIIASAGPSGYPPPTSWPAIDAAILAQCDSLDGAADGILEDPSLCNFRPEAVICAPGTTNNATCITGKQAATIRAIFSPLYGVDGAFVYPRLQPGTTLVAAIYGIYARAQFPYTDDWFKYAVYNNPQLNTSFLTPAQWAYAWRQNPGNINTWEGDLSAVRARGAKVLHYHGQEDNIITSTSSNYYYDHVARTMNLPSASLDDFYRFFRVSGMGHCAGGRGAGVIGNRLSGYQSLDPQENVLTAMVKWVEQGVAPETLTGTRWVNGTKALGVEYTRRHCRYPTRNVFVGTGDAKNPDSWKCI